MSRYFTEENDGGMSAEVFTISKDDTNHASKIRSSVMREKGKEYALSCSWKNRAEEWSTMLGLNKKKWIFYL